MFDSEVLRKTTMGVGTRHVAAVHSAENVQHMREMLERIAPPRVHALLKEKNPFGKEICVGARVCIYLQDDWATEYYMSCCGFGKDDSRSACKGSSLAECSLSIAELALELCKLGFSADKVEREFWEMHPQFIEGAKQ